MPKVSSEKKHIYIYIDIYIAVVFVGRKEYRCVGFVIIEVHHGNCILTNTVCYCPWLRVVFKDVW